MFQDGSLSATGDSVIVIGAASKGIIQRDQQHNVQVSSTLQIIRQSRNTDCQTLSLCLHIKALFTVTVLPLETS